MTTILCILRLTFGCFLIGAASASATADTPPNIILVMADDQGWGQTSYYNHPVLQTPNLDAMAANGLRFDRFYAGAPNCSPTRATVLTGRSNDRVGVHNHGYALRRQETTVAHALRDADYSTGHFGKWHLNGYRGPGAPIFADDSHHPGVVGFDEWVSVTNFFDRDPVMSRKGAFEQFNGDSSEIIVAEALKFIAGNAQQKKPFFAVVWYGSPHSPWQASDEDRKPFAELDENSQNHYGELVAMDRSIGTLRKGLRDLNVAENTIVWYCSDNGGLPKISPETVGGLRGFKGSVFEGGLRVPCVIEWPAVITQPRVTMFPAATLDIFSTIAEIVGLPTSVLLTPNDGISIRAVFDNEVSSRTKPIPFRHIGRAAWIDNDYKLLTADIGKDEFQLYDLVRDPKETTDLFAQKPDIANRLVKDFRDWNKSVELSVAGKDFPEGRVLPGEPKSRDWSTSPEYQSFIREWKPKLR